MNDISFQNDTELQLLYQLFLPATRDASSAMCRWTGSLITLTLDEVRRIPLSEVCANLNINDEILTMVVLSLEGNFGGEMILTFDDENGRQLAAALLGREVSDGSEWTMLEKSALTETGNILGCSYMNALTKLIGHELVPSPPYFIQDYGASVLQQALIVQAIDCDEVIVCQTGFYRDGEELNWRVIFVPTDAMRKAMENALKYES